MSVSNDTVEVRPTGDEVLITGGTYAALPPDSPPAARAAYGVTGLDVTGIGLLLADGSVVTATVSNGLWGAWWPGGVDRRVRAVRVTTATGNHDLDPSTIAIRLNGTVS